MRHMRGGEAQVTEWTWTYAFALKGECFIVFEAKRA